MQRKKGFIDAAIARAALPRGCPTLAPKAFVVGHPPVGAPSLKGHGLLNAQGVRGSVIMNETQTPRREIVGLLDGPYQGASALVRVAAGLVAGRRYLRTGVHHPVTQAS